MTEALVRVRTVLDSRAVYYAIVAGVVLSLAASFYVGSQQQRLTECVAAYNDAANANTRFRAETAAEERRLQDELFAAQDKALGLPSSGDRIAALKDAFLAYEKGRAFAEGKRAAAPIPPPPSQTCG